MTEIQNMFVEIEETDQDRDPTHVDMCTRYTPEIVLTRYLYIKEDVMASLIVSILRKDVDQALFWTCELYYSGFSKNVTEFVYMIYCQIFRSKNPKLCKLMTEFKERWEEGAHIVGTMVRNMTVATREYTIEYFLAGEEDPPNDPNAKPEPKLQIVFRAEDMKKYETVEKTDTLKARHILEHVCRFSTKKDMVLLLNCCHRDVPRETLLQMHHVDWLYYASFSPIWSDRICKYNGTVDHVNKRVVFEDDDDTEDFYVEYGYEPDEQKMDIQSKYMHLDKDVEQMTIETFAEQITIDTLVEMFESAKV